MNGTVRQLYPVHEAAEMLGVGRSTMYLLAKQNKVEFVKIGKRSLVTGESLERFIESLKAAHNAGAE